MSERQRSERTASVPDVPARSTGAVADGVNGQKVRPVGKNARSRSFLAERLQSARNYAQFAAVAAVDIFDGEPIERFAAVGKFDDRTLRMRAQELRESVFIEMTKRRPAQLQQA